MCHTYLPEIMTAQLHTEAIQRDREEGTEKEVIGKSQQEGGAMCMGM